MTKCLVTKLQGVVNNDSLVKLGYLKVQVTPHAFVTNIADAKSSNANCSFSFNAETGVSISENVVITDNASSPAFIAKDFVAKAGVLYYCTKLNNLQPFDVNLVKSSLMSLSNNSTNSYYRPYNNLGFLPSMNNLILRANSHTSVDLLSIPTLSNLSVNVGSEEIEFSDFREEFEPTSLILRHCRFKNLTQAPKSNIVNTYEISSSCMNIVIPDITTLIGKDTCYSRFPSIFNITGDLSLLKSRFLSVSTSGVAPTASCTWGTGNACANFIGLERVRFATAADTDRMLIAQAEKPFQTSITAQGSWERNINIYGTRTSASDAAVQKLIERGCVVTITAI